jgi:hypothetical protein
MNKSETPAEDEDMDQRPQQPGFVAEADKPTPRLQQLQGTSRVSFS